MSETLRVCGGGGDGCSGGKSQGACAWGRGVGYVMREGPRMTYSIPLQTHKLYQCKVWYQHDATVVV